MPGPTTRGSASTTTPSRVRQSRRVSRRKANNSSRRDESSSDNSPATPRVSTTEQRDQQRSASTAASAAPSSDKATKAVADYVFTPNTIAQFKAALNGTVTPMSTRTSATANVTGHGSRTRSSGRTDDSRLSSPALTALAPPPPLVGDPLNPQFNRVLQRKQSRARQSPRKRARNAHDDDNDNGNNNAQRGGSNRTRRTLPSATATRGVAPLPPLASQRRAAPRTTIVARKKRKKPLHLTVQIPSTPTFAVPAQHADASLATSADAIANSSGRAAAAADGASAGNHSVLFRLNDDSGATHPANSTTTHTATSSSSSMHLRSAAPFDMPLLSSLPRTRSGISPGFALRSPSLDSPTTLFQTGMTPATSKPSPNDVTVRVAVVVLFNYMYISRSFSQATDPFSMPLRSSSSLNHDGSLPSVRAFDTALPATGTRD